MSFAVDLAALDLAAKGIEGALTVLREEGIHGEEDSGQPIQDWTLSPGDMGHEGAADALEELLLRARYETRRLFAGTNDLVDRLKDTRTTYQKVDEEVRSAFAGVMNTVFGAPPAPQQGGR